MLQREFLIHYKDGFFVNQRTAEMKSVLPGHGGFHVKSIPRYLETEDQVLAKAAVQQLVLLSLSHLEDSNS